MSTTTSLLPAQFLAVIVETLLVGIALVTSHAAIHVLVFKRALLPNSHPFQGVLFWVVLVLACASIAHWIIDVSLAYDAFIGHPGELNSALYYAHISDPRNVARTVIYVVEAITSDLILTYRLYIVWNRNKLVVVFPILAIVATNVCGIGFAVAFARTALGADIYTSGISRWIVGTFASVLICNCYASVLIAYPIWMTRRNLHLHDSNAKSSVWNSIEIIVESAFIYTAAVSINMALFLAKSNWQYVALAALGPLLVITFCLITVRVELGVSHSAVPQRVRVSHIGSRGLPQHRLNTDLSSPSTLRREPSVSDSFAPDNVSYELKPRELEVIITRDIEVDLGRESSPHNNDGK